MTASSAPRGHDPPSPLRHLPDLEGLAQARLQAEDFCQSRFGKRIAHHALLLGSFGLGAHGRARRQLASHSTCSLAGISMSGGIASW
jgi:hypothetical protein